MVIQEEANMLRDVPMRWVLELFRRTLWPECALGRSAIGTAETIGAMTRDSMFDYMARGYGAAGVLFVASGGITHESVCDIVRDCFADAPERSSSAFDPAVDARGEAQLTVEVRPIEQTHVILGTPSLPASHEDRHVLSILNVILGGNKSSRLFEEVRDRRGLAYQISSVAFGLSDTGAFLVQAGVDNSKLCETLDVIMAEMARVATEPVEPGELGRAVEYCRGQFVLEHEDTLNRMLWSGESRLSLGRVPTIDEELAALSAVTADDVQRVASALFRNDRLTMAAIGPIDNEDEVRSHLHLPL
jgi:predicted Zn-dependent peptidase